MSSSVYYLLRSRYVAVWRSLGGPDGQRNPVAGDDVFLLVRRLSCVVDFPIAGWPRTPSRRTCRRTVDEEDELDVEDRCTGDIEHPAAAPRG